MTAMQCEQEAQGSHKPCTVYVWLVWLVYALCHSVLVSQCVRVYVNHEAQCGAVRLGWCCTVVQC